MDVRVASRGAIAGAVAALVWAGAEPLLSRALRSPYSDVRLLGRLAVRKGAGWRLAGLAWHTANGAAFGAAFAALGGRGWKQGVLAAEAESAILFPGMAVLDLIHPDVRSSAWPRMVTSPRVFAHEVVTHGLFGAVLGALVERPGSAPDD